MNNASKTTFPYKWLLFFGILIIIIAFAISSTIRANSLILLTPVPTPDPAAPYDPALYGIPDTIAGYEVLAVMTSDNTTCMRSGIKQLILRAVARDFETFQNNINADAVIRELEMLGKAQEYGGISYVGPGTSKEQIIALNENQNEQNRKVGCPNFGGSIQLQDEQLTPPPS